MKMNRLDVRCRPSIKHLGFLITTHGLALFALTRAEHPVWLLAGLTICIGISLVHFARLTLLKHPDSICRLVATQGSWHITFRNGEIREVKLTGDVVVWPTLVAARFKDKRGTYPMVLMPDSVTEFDHRRSRIYFSFYAFDQLLPDDNHHSVP